MVFAVVIIIRDKSNYNKILHTVSAIEYFTFVSTKMYTAYTSFEFYSSKY